MKKRILDHRIILCIWPIAMIGVGIVINIMLFVFSWMLLGAQGYDYGDHPTDPNSNMIYWAIFFVGLTLPTIIAVSFTGFITFISKRKISFWKDFKLLYTSFVEISWIIIILIVVTTLILLLVKAWLL